VPFTFVPIPRTFVGWLPHLKDPEVRVYLALATQSLAYNTFACTMPMTVLQEFTHGLSRTTIFRAVKSLEDRGLLRVERGVKRVSRYEILTPPCVSPVQHAAEFDVAPVKHGKAV
jgi:hypothetical protein